MKLRNSIIPLNPQHTLNQVVLKWVTYSFYHLWSTRYIWKLFLFLPAHSKSSAVCQLCKEEMSLLRLYHWEPNHFNPINMTEEKNKIIMVLIFHQNVVSFFRYSLKQNSTLFWKKKRKDQWIKVLVSKPSDLNLIARTHRVGRKNPWS